MTLTNKRVIRSLLWSALAGACGGEAPDSPGPTTYAWPDSLSFLVEFVSESRADTVLVARYEERKAVRLVRREDRFLVWRDSVSRLTLEAGREPQAGYLSPEDTLQFYVSLGERGTLGRAEPACDPAVASCVSALRSVIQRELRRLIPRLPVWSPPRGFEWVDTLEFDDAARPRGTRGTVVTTYRVVGDSVIEGETLWVVAWRSLQTAFGAVAAPADIGSVAAMEETGVAFVDQRSRVPVFVTWAGGVVAPPALRAAGVTSTGFRGRAYLAGSLVERLLSP